MISSYCIIFYLCSTYIVHRPSSILCRTTAFCPGSFRRPSFPPKTPQCSVQRRTSNQMLRHIMQAYKPKQGVCEAVFYVSGPPS